MAYEVIQNGEVIGTSETIVHIFYGQNEAYQECSVDKADGFCVKLPKEFVLPPAMSLSDMFKTIGNGVPYKAAYGIAKTILEFINYKYEDNSGKHRKSNK